MINVATDEGGQESSFILELEIDSLENIIQIEEKIRNKITSVNHIMKDECQHCHEKDVPVECVTKLISVPEICIIFVSRTGSVEDNIEKDFRTNANVHKKFLK